MLGLRSRQIGKAVRFARPVELEDIIPWRQKAGAQRKPQLIGALTGSRGQVDGRIEVERDFAHNRTAPIETDTAGFTLVNASLDYHPFAANPELTLSLQGNNLFDVNARRSTSILKDYAPLAGRDIRLSARIAF